MPEPVQEEEDDDYDEDIYDDIRVNNGVSTGVHPSNASKGDNHEEDSEDEMLRATFEEEDVVRDPVFCRNILELVVAAVKEGHPVDSTLLEIKGLKFAQNKVWGERII